MYVPIAPLFVTFRWNLVPRTKFIFDFLVFRFLVQALAESWRSGITRLIDAGVTGTILLSNIGNPEGLSVSQVSKMCTKGTAVPHSRSSSSSSRSHETDTKEYAGVAWSQQRFRGRFPLHLSNKMFGFIVAVTDAYARVTVDQ